MSLLHEIHSQSRPVRMGLWALSVFTVVSVVGYFWLSSLERTLFEAMHDDPGELAAFHAGRDARGPKPLAAAGQGLTDLGAAIGNILGLDRSAGFDRLRTKDKVYLLPLSD
jgi:hypothetical protein